MSYEDDVSWVASVHSESVADAASAGSSAGQFATPRGRVLHGQQTRTRMTRSALQHCPGYTNV